MSFSSTDSFEVDLLLDDDDMMDINPFWSSDEEDENEDEKKKETQKPSAKEGEENEERKISGAGAKRDSGIVLTDTKEDVENTDRKSDDSDDSAIHESKLEQVEEGMKKLTTEEKPELKRNLSEENKLYCIKDKDGKIIKEDDMSREYSRQRSESKGMY